MPDFNFAKGGEPRDPGKRIPRSPDTSASPPQGERPSVLDKYPARDLSHLSGQTPPPPGAEDAPPETPNDASSPAADETAETPAASDGGGDAGAGTGSPKKGGNGPLIAILGIVLFLVLIAFLWHVNPFPSVRDALAGLFTVDSADAVTNVATPEGPGEDAATGEEDFAPPLRSWDYFLQVSSWDDLAKADLDAERFRAQGLDVVVESEYIPRRRRTFYRVRLGPYENPAEAAAIKEQYAAVIPSDAFLDSTRLAEDEQVETEMPAQAVTSAAPRSAPPPTPVSEFDVITEPLSGWAVKVSSLKELDIARREARKLVGLGYPAFITKKRIGATNWYRVLVGPFSERRDADRYMELLNVTYGNEAYTVDLAAN